MFFSIFSSNIKSLTYWMYQIHFDGSLRHLSIQLSNPILAIDGGIHWETLLMGDVSLFRFSNICSWCDHVLQSTKMCPSFKSPSFWKTRTLISWKEIATFKLVFCYFKEKKQTPTQQSTIHKCHKYPQCLHEASKNHRSTVSRFFCTPQDYDVTPAASPAWGELEKKTSLAMEIPPHFP